MAFPPPVPGFASEAAAGRAAARRYRVTPDVELICYWVDAALAPLASGAGCYLYAFLRAGRELGRWAYSSDFANVRGAMGRFRAAGSPREAARAPGGEPADLGRARDALFTAGGRPLPPGYWLDLEALAEGRSPDRVDGPDGAA